MSIADMIPRNKEVLSNSRIQLYVSRLISLGFSVLGIPSKVTTQVLECHLLASAALATYHKPLTN